MRRHFAFALPFALVACSGGGADADNDGTITQEEAAQEMQKGPEIAMEPGQWEHTVSFTQLDMPGAPEQMKQLMQKNMTANVTSKNCLTPDEVKQPDAKFFAGEGNGNCTYDEFDRSGGHLKMRMTCNEGNGKSVIAMEGDFAPTKYAFDVSTTVEGMPQGPMTMKGKVSARRVGECAG